MAKEIRKKIFGNDRSIRDIRDELTKLMEKKSEFDYRELVKTNEQIVNEQNSNLPSSFYW